MERCTPIADKRIIFDMLSLTALIYSIYIPLSLQGIQGSIPYWHWPDPDLHSFCKLAAFLPFCLSKTLMGRKWTSVTQCFLNSSMIQELGNIFSFSLSFWSTALGANVNYNIYERKTHIHTLRMQVSAWRPLWLQILLKGWMKRVGCSCFIYFL